MSSRRPSRVPGILVGVLHLAAKLLYEVSRVVVDSRRHHHTCLFTDASRPPSCVVTGYSNCTGKAKR